MAVPRDTTLCLLIIDRRPSLSANYEKRVRGNQPCLLVLVFAHAQQGGLCGASSLRLHPRKAGDRDGAANANLGRFRGAALLVRQNSDDCRKRGNTYVRQCRYRPRPAVTAFWVARNAAKVSDLLLRVAAKYLESVKGARSTVDPVLFCRRPSRGSENSSRDRQDIRFPSRRLVSDPLDQVRKRVSSNLSNGLMGVGYGFAHGTKNEGSRGSRFDKLDDPFTQFMPSVLRLRFWPDNQREHATQRSERRQGRDDSSLEHPRTVWRFRAPSIHLSTCFG